GSTLSKPDSSENGSGMGGHEDGEEAAAYVGGMESDLEEEEEEEGEGEGEETGSTE
ncbi:hypothetical protein HK102_012794, partial [Quaeritorhiza haematococci]